MSVNDGAQLPVLGSSITTACGTADQFSHDTPRAVHEGKWIFFCTPACRHDFLQDPENSCLVSHSRPDGQ